MSTQFIRYTPDIEATEPNFDENLQIVIDKLEEYIAGSVTTEGTGRAVRDAHAKGYGVVKAEVEILGKLPVEYAQGIYAVPGKHGALIRFSNGQPHVGPDMLLGPVTGMALKIFDINGPTHRGHRYGWLAAVSSYPAGLHLFGHESRAGPASHDWGKRALPAGIRPFNGAQPGTAAVPPDVSVSSRAGVRWRAAVECRGAGGRRGPARWGRVPPPSHGGVPPFHR